MSINFYNATVKKSIPAFSYAFSNSLELFLLSTIASFGLIGSAYLFNQNINMEPSTSVMAAMIQQEEEDKVIELKDDFNKLIKIGGKKKTGETLDFELDFDHNQSRYVLEMGDGMRIIITRPSFTYTYKEPGKYTLELKEINQGLIQVKATTVLKIK
jgi:hypothetical protein